jgi:type I restriction enzyme M protein
MIKVKVCGITHPHAWRGEVQAIERWGEYADVPGFCKSAPLVEVRKHGHVPAPGCYHRSQPEDVGIHY